jgi:hypothetical protein
MEFLASSNINSRQQLLAVGDESGTLHIFEIPRNITRTVHREEAIMSKFLDRELQVPPSLTLDPLLTLSPSLLTLSPSLDLHLSAIKLCPRIKPR